MLNLVNMENTFLMNEREDCGLNNFIKGKHHGSKENAATDF